MLNTFVAEVPLGVDRLRAAIWTGSVREAVERVDSLYSLCASLGAWESARGFESFERAIKGGIGEDASASLESLASLVDRLVDYLRHEWLERPAAEGSPLLADHSIVPPGLGASAQKAA
jgi:hypothetical protein